MSELYKFVEGSTVWTYTSSDIPLIDVEGVFLPRAMGRDEIENRNELAKANVTITLPVTDDLAIRLIGTVIEVPVTLTIFSKIDLSTNTIWKGRLASVKPDGDSVKLVFESVATSLRRYGLRKKYQRSCPHVLYGSACKANKAAFAVSASVVGMPSANAVIVQTTSSYFPPYFVGGMLQTASGVMRFIVEQSEPTGTPPSVQFTITLIRVIEALTPGSTVTIYPGCDRSRAVCDGVFGNLVNNGSFPFIPLTNPFDGKPII
jgi:uncharacterized phage protein (TIGR02218 family)